MHAGIIAAGWGERLGQKVPKALTPVGNKKLIDFALDGLTAAGVTHVTCIVNESARDVPTYVAQSKRPLTMDWIIQTTPSSMHSFIIVLERLAQLQPSPPTPLPQHGEGSPSNLLHSKGEGGRRPDEGGSQFFISTVDSVCLPAAYVQFAREMALFPQADVILGLTNVIDDEKPLRVAMRGEEGTGLMPKTVHDNPEAFEILAMTNVGFDSEYITSGFYGVKPAILKEKNVAMEKQFSALRQYLGHLLKFGYRTYGIPLPPVIDVDRPQDIQAAETLLTHVKS